MTKLNAIAIRLIMCARCEARPGDSCVTISGALSTRPHSARTNPVVEAWRIGYLEGANDARARLTRGTP